jgi:hypothetical protein
MPRKAQRPNDVFAAPPKMKRSTHENYVSENISLGSYGNSSFTYATSNPYSSYYHHNGSAPAVTQPPPKAFKPLQSTLKLGGNTHEPMLRTSIPSLPAPPKRVELTSSASARDLHSRNGEPPQTGASAEDVPLTYMVSHNQNQQRLTAAHTRLQKAYERARGGVAAAAELAELPFSVSVSAAAQANKMANNMMHSNSVLWNYQKEPNYLTKDRAAIAAFDGQSTGSAARTDAPVTTRFGSATWNSTNRAEMKAFEPSAYKVPTVNQERKSQKNYIRSELLRLPHTPAFCFSAH